LHPAVKALSLCQFYHIENELPFSHLALSPPTTTRRCETMEKITLLLIFCPQPFLTFSLYLLYLSFQFCEWEDNDVRDISDLGEFVNPSFAASRDYIFKTLFFREASSLLSPSRSVQFRFM
jgi:hypothetical protein